MRDTLMTAALITEVVAATLWLIVRLAPAIDNLVTQGRTSTEAYAHLLTVRRALATVVWASALVWLYLRG